MLSREHGTPERILSLLSQSTKTGKRPLRLTAAEIIEALQMADRASAVYTALNRLMTKGLLAKNLKAYRPTRAGLGLMSKALEAPVWQRDAFVQTARARYRILELLRPSRASSEPSAAVYKAEVADVAPGPAEQVLLKSNVVVVKTLHESVVVQLMEAPSDDRSDFLATLNELFDTETRKVESAPPFANVARTLDWGRRLIAIPRRKPMRVPFVVQEYVDGDDLPAWLANKASQSSDLSWEDWFSLADALVEGLAEVHASGTYHRRICPSTILIKQGRPIYVDLIEAIFYAELPNTIVEPGLQGGDESCSSLFAAPEARQPGFTPTREADIYSLGAVLFYLLTKRAPDFPSTETDTERLKRLVSVATADSAARDNYGISDIVSRCLRHSTESRISDAHAVAADIHLFRGGRRAFSFKEASNLVGRAGEMIAADPRDVFSSLAAVELGEFGRAIDQLGSGFLTVGQGHENLVLKLSSYLSTLGEGDEYWAVTIPQFWSRHNLGVRGRYLSMNAEVARRGAKVLRVFLLTKDDFQNDEVRSVIDAQLEVENKIKSGRTQVGGTLDLRYRMVTAKQHAEAIIKDQFGVWVRGQSLVQVKPIYSSDGVITRVTIRRVASSQADMKRKWFNRFFDGSIPLAQWVSGGPA